MPRSIDRVPIELPRSLYEELQAESIKSKRTVTGLSVDYIKTGQQLIPILQKMRGDMAEMQEEIKQTRRHMGSLAEALRVLMSLKTDVADLRHVLAEFMGTFEKSDRARRGRENQQRGEWKELKAAIQQRKIEAAFQDSTAVALPVDEVPSTVQGQPTVQRRRKRLGVREPSRTERRRAVIAKQRERRGVA